MQNQSRKPQFPLRPAGSSPNVTSAVGLEETAGHQRARRSLLFTRTVIGVTGLVCLAFLLATLAQAWSNSQLMQRVQTAQQQLQQTQAHHTYLSNLANHYKDPFVIESEARQQLGYVRPGEHLVVIVSATSPSQSTAPHHSQPTTAQGYWQAWWNIFFGH